MDVFYRRYLEVYQSGRPSEYRSFIDEHWSSVVAIDATQHRDQSLVAARICHIVNALTIATPGTQLSAEAIPVYRVFDVFRSVEETPKFLLPLRAQLAVCQYIECQLDYTPGRNERLSRIVRELAWIGEQCDDAITRDLCKINQLGALAVLYRSTNNDELATQALRLLDGVVLEAVPARARIIFSLAKLDFLGSYGTRHDRFHLAQKIIAELGQKFEQANNSDKQIILFDLPRRIVQTYEYSSRPESLEWVLEFHRRKAAPFLLRDLDPSQREEYFVLKYLADIGIIYRLKFERTRELIFLYKSAAYTGRVFRRIIRSAAPERASFHYALTLRVLFEQTRNPRYLEKSYRTYLTVLGDKLAKPESIEPTILGNFATTVWQVGVHLEDPEFLWAAYGFYKVAIGDNAYAVLHLARTANMFEVLSDLGAKAVRKGLSDAELKELFKIAIWFEIVGSTLQSHQAGILTRAIERFRKMFLVDDDWPTWQQQLNQLASAFPRAVDRYLLDQLGSENVKEIFKNHLEEVLHVWDASRIRVLMLERFAAIPVSSDSPRDIKASLGASILEFSPARMFGESQSDLGKVAHLLAIQRGAGFSVQALAVFFSGFIRVQRWIVSIGSGVATGHSTLVADLVDVAQEAHKLMHQGSEQFRNSEHADTSVEHIVANLRAVFTKTNDEQEVAINSLFRPVDFTEYRPSRKWLWLVIVVDKRDDEWNVRAFYNHVDADDIQRQGIFEAKAELKSVNVIPSLISLGHLIRNEALKFGVSPVIVGCVADSRHEVTSDLVIRTICDAALCEYSVVRIAFVLPRDERPPIALPIDHLILLAAENTEETILGAAFRQLLALKVRKRGVKLQIVNNLSEVSCNNPQSSLLVYYGHGAWKSDNTLSTGPQLREMVVDGASIIGESFQVRLPSSAVLLSCSIGSLHSFDTHAVGGFATALLASGVLDVIAAGTLIDELRAFVYGSFLIDEVLRNKPIADAHSVALVRIRQASREALELELGNLLKSVALQALSDAASNDLDKGVLLSEKQSGESGVGSFDMRHYMLW